MDGRDDGDGVEEAYVPLVADDVLDGALGHMELHRQMQLPLMLLLR